MIQSTDFPDWEDEAGNRIAFTSEAVLERLAPLARVCRATHARLVSSFAAGDMRGFIKAFRRLSAKRRDEMSVTHAIAMHLLPPSRGMVKVSLHTGPCPRLSATELKQLALQARRPR